MMKMDQVRSMNDIIAEAPLHGRTVAVAAAHDTDVLRACVDAHRAGIAAFTLIGHKTEIEYILPGLGQDPADWHIIPEQDERVCAALAAQEVAEGRAQVIMKGIVNTAVMMKGVLHTEGLLTGKLLSHVMIYEVPSYPRLLAMTDGGVIPYPTLEQKGDILENCARLLVKLGYEHINAACVCGAELVNPKIAATVEADALARMTERWKPYNMDVFGPVGLDLAVSPRACQHKDYYAPGCGEADILLVPSYEVGNGIGKSMTYFAGAHSAGVVLGARAPIVLCSRADDARTKLASIALGCLASK